MSERIENCLKSSYDSKITGRGKTAPILQNPDGTLISIGDQVAVNRRLTADDVHVTQKPRMILNPNQDVVTKIIKRINDNDGYCPCRPRDEAVDTRCPCLNFLNTGECCCSLFVSDNK